MDVVAYNFSLVMRGLLAVTFFCLASGSGYSEGLADAFSNKNLLKRFTDQGIYPNLSYNGEYATNFRGGQRPHHHTYADQETAQLVLSGNQLLDLEGTPFSDTWLTVAFTNRHGHDLAQRYINSAISVQEIYGEGQTYRLTTLGITKSFADDLFNIQIGRFASMDSYWQSPSYCLFQSVTLCGYPVINGRNQYPTSFPVGAWGTRLRYNITKSLALTTGIYEAPGPNYVKHSKHGFYWGTKYTKGLWLPVELKYHTDSSNSQYPTILAIGGALDTSNGIYGKNKKFKHRYEIWMQADQMIWKPSPEDTRGIVAFAGLGLGTSKSQTYSTQLFGGFHYDGPFASRPDDIFGFMGSWLHRNKDFRNRTSRRHPDYITFEVNYTYQVSPGFQIMPNIQWAIHPDGFGKIEAPEDGRIKNALVFGTQFTLDMSTMFGVAKPKVPF